MSERIRSMLYNIALNEDGGGLGTLFIGLMVILLLLTSLINIADYSLYTYKRNEISKAMDFAVTAAAQQIEPKEATEGISKGFSDVSGQSLLEGVEINISQARTIFQDIFHKNISSSVVSINDNLLLCSAYSQNGKLKYTTSVGGSLQAQGELEDPAKIEEVINAAISRFWPDNEKTGIYVSGNHKTNMIEKGTYLFAVVNAIEIEGLVSKRKVSLLSFAGAKLERITPSSQFTQRLDMPHVQLWQAGLSKSLIYAHIEFL